MADRLFVCESCSGVFQKTRTEAECRAEADALFGPIPDDDRALVCDDCFREFMAWYERIRAAES